MCMSYQVTNDITGGTDPNTNATDNENEDEPSCMDSYVPPKPKAIVVGKGIRAVPKAGSSAGAATTSSASIAIGYRSGKIRKFEVSFVLSPVECLS